MAREPSPQDEMRDAMRREPWALSGPNRIVKVLPIARPLSSALRGFVCAEKSLLGKTPQRIESALGLPPGSLAQGCRIFRFTRLPMTSEVEYELSAAFPDGQAYNPAHHSDRYLPGDASIHQWRLLVDVPAVHLMDLSPGSVFPYSMR